MIHDNFVMYYFIVLIIYYFKNYIMQENYPNYYEIISRNLKELRLSHKLSQEKFAEIIGCSREYISRLENNKEQISLQMLLNISKIFELKPEIFFNY